MAGKAASHAELDYSRLCFGAQLWQYSKPQYVGGLVYITRCMNHTTDTTSLTSQCEDTAGMSLDMVDEHKALVEPP